VKLTDLVNEWLIRQVKIHNL